MPIRKIITRLGRGRFSIPKRPKTFQIERVKNAGFQKAAEFMGIYYSDDPLLQWAQRLHGAVAESKCDHEKQEQLLSALWLSLLKHDLSLQMIHHIHHQQPIAAAKTKSAICGLSINVPHNQEQIFNDTMMLAKLLTKNRNTYESNRVLHTLLLAWAQITSEPVMPNIGKNPRIMEIAGVAVKHRYRGIGIAEKLIQSSTHFAILKGYQCVRVDCTNFITAKICERNGFDLVWEMPFHQLQHKNNAAADVSVAVDTTNLLSTKETDRAKVFVKIIDPNLKLINSD